MIVNLIWLLIGVSCIGAVAAVFVAVLDAICRYASKSKTSKIYAYSERTGRSVFPRIVR